MKTVLIFFLLLCIGFSLTEEDLYWNSELNENDKNFCSEAQWWTVIGNNHPPSTWTEVSGGVSIYRVNFNQATSPNCKSLVLQACTFDTTLDWRDSSPQVNTLISSTIVNNSVVPCPADKNVIDFFDGRALGIQNQVANEFTFQFSRSNGYLVLGYNFNKQPLVVIGSVVSIFPTATANIQLTNGYNVTLNTTFNINGILDMKWDIETLLMQGPINLNGGYASIKTTPVRLSTLINTNSITATGNSSYYAFGNATPRTFYHNITGSIQSSATVFTLGADPTQNFNYLTISGPVTITQGTWVLPANTTVVNGAVTLSGIISIPSGSASFSRPIQGTGLFVANGRAILSGSTVPMVMNGGGVLTGSYQNLAISIGGLTNAAGAQFTNCAITMNGTTSSFDGVMNGGSITVSSGTSATFGGSALNTVISSPGGLNMKGAIIKGTTKITVNGALTVADSIFSDTGSISVSSSAPVSFSNVIFNSASYYPSGQVSSLYMGNCSLPSNVLTISVPATFADMSSFAVSAQATSINFQRATVSLAAVGVSISGTVTLQGQSSFSGSSSLNGQINITGVTTFGAATGSHSVNITGTIVVLNPGTLSINSASISGGSIVSSGVVNCVTSCTIPSLAIQNGATLAGTISTSTMSVNGNITFQRAAVTSPSVTVGSSVNIMADSASTITTAGGLSVPNSYVFSYLGGSAVIRGVITIGGSAVISGLTCDSTINLGGILTLNTSANIAACTFSGSGTLGIAAPISLPNNVQNVALLGGTLSIPASVTLTSVALYDGSITSATTPVTLTATSLVSFSGRASISNVGVVVSNSASFSGNLTISTSIVNNGNMLVSGGSINGAVSNYGSISASSGYVNNIKNYNTINVPAAASMNVNGLQSNGTITVYGNLTIISTSDATSLILYPSGSLFGPFSISNLTLAGSIGTGANVIVTNIATITAGTKNISGTLTLDGVTKISGPSSFSGTGRIVNNGQFDASIASPLSFFCAFSNNGNFTIPDNGVIDVFGEYEIIQPITASNINFTVYGKAIFNWASGVNNNISNLILTVPGSLVFAKLTVFTDLNISGTIASISPNYATGNSLQMKNGTIAGAISVVNMTIGGPLGFGSYASDAADITINGTLVLANNLTMSEKARLALTKTAVVLWRNRAVFTGTGTVISGANLTLPSDYSPFQGVRFEATGAVIVSPGQTIVLNADSSSAVSLATGSTAYLAGGSFSQSASITGSGTVIVTGSVVFSGTLDVPYINILSGSLDYNGTQPLQSYFVWSSGSIYNINLGKQATMIATSNPNKKRDTGSHTLYGTLQNSGSLFIDTSIVMATSNATINNNGNMTVSNNTDSTAVRIGPQDTNSFGGRILNYNQASFNSNGAVITSDIINYAQLAFTGGSIVVGTLIGLSGNISINLIQSNSSITVTNNGATIGIGSNATIQGAGTIVGSIQNNGTIVPGIGLDTRSYQLSVVGFSQSPSGLSIFNAIPASSLTTGLNVVSVLSLAGTVKINMNGVSTQSSAISGVTPYAIRLQDSTIGRERYTRYSDESAGLRTIDNYLYIVSWESRNELIPEDTTGGGDNSKNNTAVIAGAVVGGVGGSILLAGGIGAAVYYKKKSRVKKVPARPTAIEMEGLSFSKGIHSSKVAKKDTSRLAQLNPLYELLLERPLILAGALNDITAATEIDRITQSLVYLFENKGRAIELIERSIDKEVAACQSAGTLFRQNSPASKMLHSYATLIGIPYLYDTLSAVLFELMEQAKTGGAAEVDPNKLTEDDDADVNKYLLMATAQKILSAVIKSLDKVPLQLRVLCHHLQASVVAKFPESRHSCVGGFFFLRFINPAILTPESYGISRELPSAEARRVLVLVTKTLQNLANGIKFGGKEQHMSSLNDFIETNQAKLNKFFDDLATVPPGAPSSFNPTAVPNNVQEVSLASIHKQISLNMPKMRGALTGEGHSSSSSSLQVNVNAVGPASQAVWEQLSRIMDESGPPVDYEEDKKI